MIHPISLTEDIDMTLTCSQSKYIVIASTDANIGTERIKKDPIGSKKLYVGSFPVT
jgi:hypothetical protein